MDAGDGVKVCITETDLNDYPGMYLWNGDGGQHLTARFAPYPKRTEQGGYNNLQMVVKEREAFIAKAVSYTHLTLPSSARTRTLPPAT